MPKDTRGGVLMRYTFKMVKGDKEPTELSPKKSIKLKPGRNDTEENARKKLPDTPFGWHWKRVL